MSDFIILSIKKEHADKILNADKSIEIRTGNCYIESGDRVILYVTKPLQRIVGQFRVGKVFREKPEKLWERTKDYNGLNEEQFFSYCKLNRGHYVGLEIKALEIFEDPINPYEIFENFRPPQSYKTLHEDSFRVYDLIKAGTVKIKNQKIKKIVVDNNGTKETFTLIWDTLRGGISYSPMVNYCKHPKTKEILMAGNDFISEYKGEGNHIGFIFD